MWADRGYDSAAIDDALRQRGITPRISRKRRPGQPIPPGTPTREAWRGKKRRLKTPDPQAHHRWPIERTNSWMKNRRRIDTRRDRKATNYETFLHLSMILILTSLF